MTNLPFEQWADAKLGDPRSVEYAIRLERLSGVPVRVKPDAALRTGNRAARRAFKTRFRLFVNSVRRALVALRLVHRRRSER